MRSDTMTTFIAKATVALLLLPAFLTGQSSVRIYSHVLNPREHPDDNRRHIRPPTWETFDNRVRFITLRGFEIKDHQLVGFTEELEKYTRTHQLGDIIWPSYPVLFAENLEDLLIEIKKRRLFLFDIWGYVPGSGPGGYWQQFEPPPSVFDLIGSTLGERWLGMDVGEQDGRYIGGYASQMYPVSADRFEQYVNFHRHFGRFTADLGNRMATLVSLNFGHYFLKEGVYTLIGAETAQALPNSQVYYAFIRGAGKQYGVPWFGNASVWNRWGWKSYAGKGADHGPTKGTSVSLLKRLLYSHVLYNSMLVGFESGWFDENGGLSPVGRVQQSAKSWTLQHGQPGVMLTPVAIMVDFFSGWSFPRHLYSRNVYRVWGNLPYESGDYLTDGVLDLLYPGYQDSSYFHDESGFLSPTPYGDIADALMSDAPGWLLDRYAVVVVAGDLLGGAEIRDKLVEYVERGGHLVITAGNLQKLPGILGTGGESSFAAGQAVSMGDQNIVEDHPFDAVELELPREAAILSQASGKPLVAEVPRGKGRITVLASPFGVSRDKAVRGAVTSGIDQPLAKPYPLLKHVRLTLDRILRGQMLFDAGKDLSLIVCRRAPRDYVVGISNNSWEEKPFRVISRIGEITSLRELTLDQSEKGTPGYLPEGVKPAKLGRSTEDTIAGGDVRIFAVSLREERVKEIPHIVPAPAPKGRYLHLRHAYSIKEAILSRPAFFQHFDGAVIDWRYLHQRSEAALRREASWIRLQNLRLTVDLTSGVNLYPDLRLIDNIESDYASSMEAIEEVLAKMEILGARDLILSLHRYPENNFTRDESWGAFERTLRRLGEQALQKNITLHLRFAAGKPPESLQQAIELLNRLRVSNLRLALSTSRLMETSAREDPPSRHVGIWLVSGNAHDVGGKLWNPHAPIAGQEERLRRIVGSAPEAPLVLDAVYKSRDEEYLDAKALARLVPSQ